MHSFHPKRTLIPRRFWLSYVSKCMLFGWLLPFLNILVRVLLPHNIFEAAVFELISQPCCIYTLLSPELLQLSKQLVLEIATGNAMGMLSTPALD